MRVLHSSLCLFPGRGPRPITSILQLTTWNPYTTPHHPNRQKGPCILSTSLTRGLLWRLKTVVCVSARPKSTSGIGHLRNLPLHSCAFGVGSFGESKSLWNEKHEILMTILALLSRSFGHEPVRTRIQKKSSPKPRIYNYTKLQNQNSVSPGFIYQRF